MTTLLSLPDELLLLLPGYLSNIEDFTNTASSCRTLYRLFAFTTRNTILRLAAASSRMLFCPSPHFLVLATARELSDWALLSQDNVQILRAAMGKGIQGLFDLCVETAGLTMVDIRRLYTAQFDLINPSADMIDKMAGKQWYRTPNFWNRGVSEPTTSYCEPERTLFQYLIYGELFASTIDSFLQPLLSLPRLDLDCRLDYVRYCISDAMYLDDNSGLREPERADANANKFNDKDASALHHVLSCRQWQQAWKNAREETSSELSIGSDEGWRHGYWKTAIQLQGLKGLEMLRTQNKDAWHERLKQLYQQIKKLDA